MIGYFELKPYLEEYRKMFLEGLKEENSQERKEKRL